LIATRLAPGGYFHAATDWEDYARHILEILSAEPLLENTAEAYAPRPDYRPLTKFEQRGLRLGHGVWDIVFRRKTERTAENHPHPNLPPEGKGVA
jgi:tRNA (guanine-N7-)-methyltransferase